MTKDLTVAFRADASFDIGTGHVMRCLTLADALVANGAVCRFICREHPGHLIEHIREKGYRIDALPAGANLLGSHGEDCATEGLPHANWLGCPWETDAAQTKAVLMDEVPDWLVVDHYALDERWEKALQGCYGRLMVIDDLADRPHACDLLLDQNLGTKESSYSRLVPKHCQLLVGPQYALLRPEFAILREYSLGRRTNSALKNIVITMGGVDQPNATGKILDALTACTLPSDCHIIVVMGVRSPWLEQVRIAASRLPWQIDVRVNIDDMAKVMADSDLAIGAAGSTSWERCVLGVPSLVLGIAENQSAVIKSLVASGASARIDASMLQENAYPRFCRQLFHVRDNLHAYSIASARITDGLGYKRVCERLR